MATINGTNNADNLLGTSSADTINGFGGDDILRGGGGIDTLNGGDGNDDLRGGGGRDVLDGGDGDDRLLGGVGKDTLTGGAGNDVFVFADGDLGATSSAADVITDFAGMFGGGADLIDLSLIDANTNVAGNQAFVSVTNGLTNDFTGNAGEVVYRHLGDGNTRIELDTDGDAVADWFISMSGEQYLIGFDFIL